MSNGNERRLIWSIFVTIVIFLGEIIGGLYSGSLSLLSDAGHVLTDTFALGLSLVALFITRKPSDFRATYGYQRIGLLAALINGCSLVAIAALIFIETYNRFRSPPEINAAIMLVVAVAGLIGNLLMTWIIGRGHKDLNIQSAWLHVLGDTLSSGGVIIAALVIRFTKWNLVDPIMSGLVGIVIVVGGFRVIKDALWVFLELSPFDLHAEEISRKICGMPDVSGVHDVHVWSIGHGIPAFSAHVLVSDRRVSETDSVRKRIEEELEHIGIRHTVLQMECAECMSDQLYCEIKHPEDVDHHHHH